MSRLRNRMTKAEFWTDPDLLSWHRDKRHFYQGLRCAAEDSGCIEDSPFGWMLVLYPSPLDRDISLEQVGAWRNELIADGKLIRYRCAGKDYLYQTTFHDHEHPRNPQAPNLPLPPWVKWIGNASDSRKGRYEVDAAAAEALLKARTTLVQGVLGDDPSEGADLQELPYTTIEQGLYNACTSVPVLPCPALSRPDQPSSNGGQPVDKCATPERGCSIEPAEPSPEPPSDQIVDNGDGAAASHTPVRDDSGTCDGNPCMAHDFPASAFAPLRRAMLVSLHPEQQKEVGTKGKLDALLEAYAAHVCAACQAAFGEFERPQRDGICEQAVVAAVANLHSSQDVAAVMKSRLLRFGLAELIGDRKLEELRRTKRDKRRKGEPQRVGTTLAPEFAGAMVKAEPVEEAS